MEQDGSKAWMSESDDRHLIKIGSLIRFSVKRFNSDLYGVNKSIFETSSFHFQIVDVCPAHMYRQYRYNVKLVLVTCLYSLM